MDDTLLWDNDIEAAFWHTFDYLTLCATNGITFNPDKFVFARTAVDFAGLRITESSTTPSTDMLRAIREFLAPKDITGARSWFGLVEQVAWAYCVKPEMAPFCELVQSSKPFYWDEALDEAFKASKTHILALVKDGV